jgi:hypothetical protein
LAASDAVGVQGGWVASSSAGGNLIYNDPARERRSANNERGMPHELAHINSASSQDILGEQHREL